MTLTPFHPFFQLATKQALDVYAALLKSARSVLYNTGWWDNARMMHLKKLELGGMTHRWKLILKITIQMCLYEKWFKYLHFLFF